MFIEKMKCNKDINVVIYLKTEVVYACMYVYLNSYQHFELLDDCMFVRKLDKSMQDV